jgi:hypothetical protein
LRSAGFFNEDFNIGSTSSPKNADYPQIIGFVVVSLQSLLMLLGEVSTLSQPISSASFSGFFLRKDPCLP